VETWGVAFLGVIALCAVAQVAAWIAVAVFGVRLSRRLGALQVQLDRELAPALADLARASRSVAELADLATARGRQIDRALGDTVERVAGTASVVHQLVGPFRAVSSALALVLALRRGLGFLRR
jgi:methyl-accepting chemotaxis protein